MKSVITSLLILAVIVTSCKTNKDDDFPPCIPPPPQKLNFRLIDGNNVDLMDSTTTHYIGSIKMISTCLGSESAVTLVPDSNGNFFQANEIYYTGYLTHFNCTQYLMVYNNGTSDTLEFEIADPTGRCSPYTMKNLRLNGIAATKSKENFHVIFTMKK